MYESASGPYRAPNVRAGDRITCRLRGPIVVDGFTSGPSPWPWSYNRGQRSLILCGDLVNAVELETIATIQRRWGVSRQLVKRWRRALGIGWCTGDSSPADGEGTDRDIPRRAIEAYQRYGGDKKAAWQAVHLVAYALIDRFGPAIEAPDPAKGELRRPRRR